MVDSEYSTRDFGKILFLIVYCLDRYKTQKVCYEAIDDCPAALKFTADWFVASEML